MHEKMNRLIQDGMPLQRNMQLKVVVMAALKVHFQQQIVMNFGAARLREILDSPDPFILPILDYRITWDVVILVLF